MRESLIAAALAALLVGIVRHDAIRRGVIDAPTARGSHAVATPRGGGVGLLLALAITLLALRGAPAGWSEWCAVAAVALVALVGWLDDHRDTPVHARLVVHIAAGALLLPLARQGGFGFPQFAPLDEAVIILLAAAWVLWTASSINAVNFMDGIDGIIGAQLLLYGVHIALLADTAAATRSFGLALSGACAGFLLWNWNPAKIFLGDVGSGALGVLAVLGGLLVLRGNGGVVAAFLPLAPIFLDASVTLLQRVRRGERLSEAHRSHLYQRLANGHHGHARVAVGYACVSAALVGLVQVNRHWWHWNDLVLLLAAFALLVPIAFLASRHATPWTAAPGPR